MKIFRKVLKILAITVCLTGILAIAVLKPAGSGNYKSEDYYKETIAGIKDYTILTPENNSFEAGWSKQNITPDQPIPVASYGIRNPYEKVHDSIFVRTFAFRAGKQVKFLITADLLIFPPEVIKIIKDSLGSEIIKTIYFSATHTHNGAGGWMNSPAERFIAGPFDRNYTLKIARSVISGIKESASLLRPAIVKTGKVSIPEIIKNRVIDNGPVEDTLRYIEIENNNKGKAVILSYNAHANCLHFQNNIISGDYPGVAVTDLESSGYDMAAFCAGAVGSMKTDCSGLPQYECLDFLGKKISQTILKNRQNTRLLKSHELTSGNLPIKIGGLSPRISESIRIRPWVFNLLIGNTDPYISFLKIGEVAFIGYPCDFSGEISRSVYQKKQGNMNLILTSFNGTYIGYVTPASYQKLTHSEVREMNWTGEQSGEFFYECTGLLLDKLNKIKK